MAVRTKVGTGAVRAGRLAVGFFLALVVAMPAAAIEHQVSILLDTDDDATTGCTVATPSGPFAGVEQVLVTTVDTVSLPADAATVTAVDRQVCAPGNVLGPPIAVDPGDWPVGLSLGVDGFHVVETYLPLAALPADARVLRAAIVVTDVDGAGSALLTTLPGAGQPIIIDLRSVLEIPTLSQWSLLLLVLLLAAAAAFRLRRLPAVAALVVVLVLSTGGVAWAACVLDGDPRDPSPRPPVAEDPPALCDGVSIRAVFAQQDPTRVCFRVDACLRFNSAPVAQDQGVVTDEDTPVAIVLTATDPDGDPITGWNVVAPGPAHGTLSGTAPNLTYTPDPDYAGPDSFQFTATDGTATSAPATVSLTVTPVNDAPVVTPAAFAVAEDAAIGAAVGTVTFTDPDAGQSHGFAITAGNTGGAFAIHPTTGQITVAAALDFETLAAYSLTVEVTDDGAPVLAGSATVDVTVTDVDDAPVAVDDATTVTEDDPATTVAVLGNDTDVDGGPMVIQSVTQPANGTVVITNGGADLTYQPDADYCNDPPGTTLDTFDYTLNGGSTATVSVTVTCVDDDPVAVDDAATVAEDAAAATVDVLANDTDVDGGAISITSVTQPTNGTVVITNAGADLTYQPDADYCNDGTPFDTFTYTLSPGGSTATVSVTVTCVDDAPVAVDDAATVAEDSGANAVAVLANDTDVDSGPISVASVTQPANGTVAITGGSTGVSYTPNANYCNDGTPFDTFTYTLAPGGSVGTVSVTVTCVDDPPTAVADAATVDEDSLNNPIDVLLNDVDLDGGPRTVTAVQSPTTAGGTVVITGGGSGVAYSPAANYCNNPPGTTPDTFTYTLNGGSNATVSVTVTCINDGPQVDLDADDDKGTAGTGFAVTFTENDPARLLADPDDPLGAVITDVDSTTLATLTVTLTNLLDAGEELLDADVSAFAPAITKDYDTTTPGVGVLTITGPASIADFVAVLRTVTYRHTGNDPDTTARVVNVVANDGTDDGNTAVSTVTVVAVDDPPVAVADAATVNEDSGANAVDVLGNDTDTDGGAISITSVTQPANGTVVITGGGTGLTYAPNANYCNDPPGSTLDTFTYTLTPGGSSTTVTMTVTCVDDAPVAVADAATVVEDSGANAVAVLANDTDADGGAISIASVTQPTNGAVVITGGGTGLTYAPNANYCNNPPGSTLDTFTYTLTPGGSSTTVTMTVTCVDDDPVAVADSATVVEDSGANAVAVLANDTDVDGGAISITSVTQPTNGTVVITGGGTGLTYAPNANYCNNPPGSPLDAFTYTLTPGGSSTTVTMTVTCVDDPPTAVADTATVDEDSGANTIDVQANDTDVDGGVNTISAVTQPTNGTVAITNGGADLSYTPNANYCNLPPGSTPDTFTYTLSPGGSSTSVSVSVNCINDPPVAGADAFDFMGNTELRVDHGPAATPHAFEATMGGTGVLENDSDPVEGDPISIVGLTVGGCVDNSAPFDCTDAAVGRVQIDADGSFSFVPAAGDTDPTEQFQYTLSDGTDTTVGTVTLTRFERIWYVKNDAPAGGNGTSTQPFNAITAANLSDNDGDGDLTDDLDSAGDYIFVHFGSGTSTGLSGGLVLEGGQHLIGEHAGLTVPVDLNGNGAPTTLVTAVPGNRPLLDDTVADGFDGVSARNVVPAEITGMSLAGNVNAIDWTTTNAFAGGGTFAIRDNVVRSAGGIGVDVNLAGTGAPVLAFHDNNVTATGTGVNIQETGTGTLTIRRFDDLVVNGNTGGSGIVVNNALFDSVAGGGLDTVDGGTAAVGALGNGVGGSGMLLTNVQGDLHFTGNLSIYADGGTGLAVTGTGAGMALRVNTGGGATGIVQATGGPAVDATQTSFDLRLSSLQSTNSATTGVSLTNVTGTFSAETGSAITNATGTDFLISGGTANVTYKGTITDDVGQLVSISGSTGGTKSFEGAITDGDDGDGSGISLANNGGTTMRFAGGLVLSTGANAAFAATGGGTLEICDELPCNGAATGGLVNRITTTTGTALNVANTNIGAGNLEFRSISAGTAGGGPVNGIVVNNSGATGGLKVKGTGVAGSGGTIQNATGDGISLVSTQNPSLAWMNVTGNDGSGIFGDDVTDFSLVSSSVTNNADTTGGTEAGLRFNELLGTCAITNSTISGSIEDNIRITPAGGVLTNLAISGTTIGPNNAITGGSGLALVGTGTAEVTVNITGSTFTGNRASGILTSFTDSAIHTVNVSTSTFQNHNTAIDLGVELNADLSFAINNNTTIVGNTANAINIVSGTGATNGADVRGTIQGNVIGNGTADSGSQNAFGIAVDLRGDVDAVLSILGNTVQNTDIEGIFIQSRLDNDADGEIGLIDLTVRDNTVLAPDDNSAFPFGFVYGTRIESRNTSNLCLDIAGNTSNGIGGAEGFRTRQRDTSTFRAERLALGAQTAATMATFVAAQNDPGSTANATAATSFTGVADGTCRNP